MRKILIILCALWIGIIFHLSGEPGKVSNAKSLTIVSYIESLYLNSNGIRNNTNLSDREAFSIPEKSNMQANEQSALTKRLNVIVRKSGHLIEYLILAIIVSSIIIKVSEKSISGIIHVLFTCLMVAVLDEFYQSFVGRTSTVRDVLIDFCGGLLGMFLYIVLESAGKLLLK